MSRFEVAFSGQTVPDIPLDTVKSNLARLFQADEQRIALLFSGRRVVIKNNLDAAGAEKYRTVMERAGALVEVVDLDATIEEIELAPPPADPEAPPPLKVAPRDEYMAAFSGVDAPDFGLAPVGADLQDAKSEPQRPQLDLSEFSVAPVGSDMGQAKAPPPAAVPDTSHLKLME